MRLTTLLLMIALIQTGAAAYGQITLKEKNAPLEKVLTAIEKQTSYVFLYDPDQLKTGPITIDVKNATLQQTLEKCFKGQPIEFSVVGNNVLLKNTQTPTAENSIGINIRGRVVDESGQPLAGVSVIDRSGSSGTITDSSGGYTITGKKGGVLRFSFVGYKDQEVRIANQNRLNVSLTINPASPEQAVVIGYGSSKKRDLTGAVSTIDVRDMSEVTYNTLDNALAGKAAGVEVTKTDGTPGGMVRVRIRGSSSLIGGNDPLYVIDGIPVQIRNNYIDPGFNVASTSGNLAGIGYGSGVALSASFVNSLNGLGGIDPADIQSISILKDASSTAIYGSKAANGVVIITTKTGTTNTPARIAVDYSTTVNSLYRAPKLLNAPQYETLLKEAAHHAYTEDSTEGFSDGFYAMIADSPSYFGTANTNWLKQVTQTTASRNNVWAYLFRAADRHRNTLVLLDTPIHRVYWMAPATGAFQVK